jgi:hypothetical protein
MSKSLSDFLVDLSQDPDLLHAYVTNRDKVIDESDLDDAHKELLKNSEDLETLRRVQDVVRAEQDEKDHARPMLIFVMHD